MKYTKTLLLFIVVFYTSCIKQVNIETRIVKPVLVVEGGISNDSVPYTVKLSYTTKLRAGQYLPDSIWEPDAIVTITDNLGSTTPLTYTEKGVYQTTDTNYVGKVGGSYYATIKLKDGRVYTSAPEAIAPPVGFKNVDAHFNNDFDAHHPTSISMNMDIDDPAGQENYYHWKTYTWLIRKTWGISCGLNCVMFEYCFQKNEDRELRIFSDAAINGNSFSQQLGKSYIYWYGRHYLDVVQESISREGYQFLKSYEEQQSRSGGVLDPLPASIKGNVHNAANENEFALGYFFASGVTHRRYVITLYNINQYMLDLSGVLQYVPSFPVACFEYFENSIPYPPPPAYPYPPPPGWEKADSIDVRW